MLWLDPIRSRNPNSIRIRKHPLDSTPPPCTVEQLGDLRASKPRFGPFDDPNVDRGQLPRNNADRGRHNGFG